MQTLFHVLSRTGLEGVFVAEHHALGYAGELGKLGSRQLTIERKPISHYSELRLWLEHHGTRFDCVKLKTGMIAVYDVLDRACVCAIPDTQESIQAWLAAEYKTPRLWVAIAEQLGVRELTAAERSEYTDAVSH